MLSDSHIAILRTLIKADAPFILEELAGTASISFEAAWYAVLELIELQLMTVAGIGLYQLTSQGQRIARQV